MPYTIKSANMKYKNNNGEYVGINAISDNTTDDQIAAIESAGASSAATQEAAIEAKGEEVLESIPQDYTTLSAEVTDLKNDLNGYTELLYGTGDDVTFQTSYPNQVLQKNGWAATLNGWNVSYAYAIPEGITYLIANYSTPNFESTTNNCAVDFYTTNSLGSSIIGYVRDISAGRLVAIPEGAKYVRLSYQDASTQTFFFADNGMIERLATAEADIATLQPKVANLETAIETAFDIEEYTDEGTTLIPQNWSVGYVESTNGQVYTGGSYDNFKYSVKIPVSQGDVVTVWNVTTDASSSFRSITAYEGDTLKASSGASSTGTSYTVPSGVNGVIVTGFNNEYSHQIHVFHSGEKTAYHVPEPRLGYMQVKGDLASGETLELLYNNAKYEQVYTFSARITTFSAVKIGINKTGTPYITVDGINLKITNSAGDTTVAHGLTIASDLQVVIETQRNNTLKRVVVSSQGEEFIYTTATGFLSDQGAPYVTSSGSTMTDCVFSWTTKDINKPIWIFGDSYISYDPARWAYYLRRDGFETSTFLNGYSGEASEKAYTALKNLLTMTTPKYVVWCLGMNNGDSSTAVNTSWKTYYDKVLNLQKKYGFELILYTTPTTPDVNNKFKNEIVRTSGFRYVDADGAVKADDNGNWISGALYTDNVHPTAKGAKIIYYQFLADLPEITAQVFS